MTDAVGVLFSLTLACLLTGGAIFAQEGHGRIEGRVTNTPVPVSEGSPW